jgi:hypothetical protein
VFFLSKILSLNLTKIFVEEINTLNETEELLHAIVLELGRRVRSAATMRSLRCVQIGNFGVDSSLGKTEWNLRSILRNIRLCHRLSKDNPELQNLSEFRNDDFEGVSIYDDVIPQENKN